MSLTQHITEILERAGKTFVEALAATMVLTPVSTGKSIAVGGLGALISAVWTTAVKLEGAKLTDLEEDAEHLFLDDDEDEDEDEPEDDEDDEPETPTPGPTVSPTSTQIPPASPPETPSTPAIGSQAQ